ncbi:MAG TPA: ester cyclase [Propionibacteriaceae bacterium]|nr:ester cyclase [Propionibacteriaceae bacterium]
MNQSPVDGFAPPAANAPKGLVNRYNWLHLQWNSRDLSKATALLAPKISYTDHASGKSYETPQQWESGADGIFSASSNAKLINRRYWLSGKHTISQFQVQGTNNKPYQGHEATNKEFTIDAAEIIEWNSSGQVIGGDLYYDRVGVLLQLGTIEPPPKQPPAEKNTSGKDPSAPPPPSGLSTMPPATIVERDRWGHDWWNARDLNPFLPLFNPVFYYVDHPVGKIVSTVPEMNEFASHFWDMTSDAQLIDRRYYQAGNLTLVTFTVAGTHDRGEKATNKKFSIEGTEFIFWSSEGTGVGGDMYFDRLTALNQLGFVPEGFAI